ncbi:MAG: ROK family glucokinase [Lachnospiraceae bacterium]|nr:ROK family glucokinase [Lachnospiraceae bacterium]
MKYIYGVDIGGTTVKIGRFTMTGELLEKFEIPTRTEEDGKKILPDVRTAIYDHIDQVNADVEEFMGIGVDVPGPVDKKGIIHNAANLGWKTFNLENELHRLFGEEFPVKALNDADAAALGELWSGSGKGYDDLMVVTLGTGIGGGVICNGHIVTGGMGSGGEIGHFHLIDDEEETCGCGNKGCFEQYCSATGLVRMATKYLSENPDVDSTLRNEEISAKSIMDEFKKGDPAARAIAEKYGYLLGKGLAVISSILDPELILIGGGVAKAGTVLIDLLKDSYMEFVFHTGRDVKFELCKLGNDAGIYGAAFYVLTEGLK